MRTRSQLAPPNKPREFQTRVPHNKLDDGPKKKLCKAHRPRTFKGQVNTAPF
jgi:hypothetical protein